MPDARPSSDEIRRLVEMPRGEFEDLVAGLYCALGHRAICTKAKESDAAHVVVQAINGQKWIVQCRQWRGAVRPSCVNSCR